MKIRSSFVGNSSTSSYLIYGKDMSIEEINKVLQAFNKTPIGKRSSLYTDIGEYKFAWLGEDYEGIAGIILLYEYNLISSEDLVDQVYDIENIFKTAQVDTTDWRCCVYHVG